MQSSCIKSGDKFYQLTVIIEVQKTDRRFRRFLWKCDCGKKTEANLSSVVSGNTLSCGCRKRKWIMNQPKREKSKSWKGGRREEDGYILIYDKEHPNAKSNGYVREHTKVMSEKIGRPLIKGENVHHKNGNKSDNRLENLELWSTSQPSGQRIKDKISWALDIIKQYGDNIKIYE